MTSPPLIGIDLVEPARLQRRLDHHPGLRNELFTEAELAYCDAQPFPEQHLAARFCAKEAVIKALAIDGFDPRDVELLGGDGPPQLRLHGDVLRRALQLNLDVSVSLTHLTGVAAAVALALPHGLRPPQGRPIYSEPDV